MDAETQVAITRALDNSIAAVAEEEFQRLSNRLTPNDVAKAIHNALDGLRGLQGRDMPNYDEWVALLYAVWYQPSRVNLAFTLARGIPEVVNPIRSNVGELQVVDFGAGEYAMQFGLAFAAAEAHLQDRPCPRLNIGSIEPNKPMSEIGKAIWHQTFSEITHLRSQHPQLQAFRQGFNKVQFGDVVEPRKTRWLTALHVAYKENHQEVWQALNERVDIRRPDLVLVTSHPSSDNWAFTPAADTYGLKGRLDIDSDGLALKVGHFSETTAFRNKLYRECIEPYASSLSDQELSFTRAYLTALDTTWFSGTDFKARCTSYTKQLP